MEQDRNGATENLEPGIEPTGYPEPTGGWTSMQ